MQNLTTVALITGRGARIKHLAGEDGTALCPSPAAQRATGRFEKLPVCSRCEGLLEEPVVEEQVEGSGEEAVVHLSARVARFMVGEVGDERLARELSEPDFVRCGRGFTAYVTTTYDRAQLLLNRLQELLEALESGERPKGAKGGMNFQPEAVAKGIEHITADLAR